MSRDNTAFNVEYVLGVIRTCFEGWTTYLNERTPLPGYAHYHAGDIWGCLGRWYSGGWYDQGALNYIQLVKGSYAKQAWLMGGFVRLPSGPALPKRSPFTLLYAESGARTKKKGVGCAKTIDTY